GREPAPQARPGGHARLERPASEEGQAGGETRPALPDGDDGRRDVGLVIERPLDVPPVDGMPEDLLEHEDECMPPSPAVDGAIRGVGHETGPPSRATASGAGGSSVW